MHFSYKNIGDASLNVVICSENVVTYYLTIMSLKSLAAKLLAKYRIRQIQKTASQPFEAQKKVFKTLIQSAQKTDFGIAHQFENIHTVADFQKNVPIRDYEQAKSYFHDIYNGKENVTWKGKPLYLAKTSGTTSGSKFIPITQESIQYQINSARDILLAYIHQTGKADFLDGKMMFLSGSPEVDTNAYGMKVGRLSGIVNHFVPAYLLKNRVPTYKTNCIEDWELKVKTIVQETINEDLRLISGIPPWVQMFFEEAQRQTGKRPLEIWKNLSVFIQGGVDFSPYKPIFQQYFHDKVDILELFPASEGFFAIQDELKDNAMLLLVDNGVFYEFVPMEQYGNADAPRLTLEQVQLHQQYAMIVSTNAGLWAYDLGDTVKFVSLNPFKIRVTGRVKHFLSAFGEHVITEEVNQAMIEASAHTNATVQEFTVAPSMSKEKGQSYHEWFVEFSQKPIDIQQFTDIVDAALQRQNPYYKDLREGNILRKCKINALQLNASREYMRAEGKLGGQNKFPRLSNNRKIADFLMDFIEIS